MRSPFFYVGDKYKLMPQLKKSFPKNIKTFYDPFCGGGSAFLNTEAKHYKCNDINRWMIKLHEYLSSYKKEPANFFSHFEELINKYGFSHSYDVDLVPEQMKKDHVKTYYAVFNKDGYNLLKNDFNSDQSRIDLLYLLLIYGFNHMIRFNRQGLFNLPVGNVDYNKNVHNALLNYFGFMAANDVTFSSEDYKAFLLGKRFYKGDFVYADPPYLITSSEYNKIWTEASEKELLQTLDLLDERHVPFALSNVLSYKGRENRILKEWAKKYKILPVTSNYINYHDNTVKNYEEVLIINY